MKIFLDTANVNEIREINEIGIIQGVTTNPTLIAKEGKDFKEVIKEITSIVDGPVNGEVLSLDAKGMVEEGRELAKIHKNMVIKIPMCEEGLKAVNILSKEGYKTNVTLIFSANQALLAAIAGATYVSPFVGRLDDILSDGIKLVGDIREIFDNYGLETEIISASIRNPEHLFNSAMVGAHIATVPYSVLKKSMNHPLTDKGIKSFIDDWNKVYNK